MVYSVFMVSMLSVKELFHSLVSLQLLHSLLIG